MSGCAVKFCRLDQLVTKCDEDTAVMFDCGSEKYMLTYNELQSFANRLSNYLLKIASAQSVVGLLAYNDVTTPSIILGILRAKCCFVYFSPNESLDYTLKMLQACHVEILISTVDEDFPAAFKPCQLNDFGLKIYKIASDFRESDTKTLTSDFREKNCETLAYIMRTSGTTGQPKIVRVPHAAILPNILDLRNIFSLNNSDVIFLCSPLTFDPSMIDIFIALSSGAKLFVVPERLKSDTPLLAKLLFDVYRVTFLQATPSFLKSFGQNVVETQIFGPSTPLRFLLLGGEAFPTRFMQICLPFDCKVQLYNFYGITEVSCWATCGHITLDMIKRNDICIGNVLSETRVKIQLISPEEFSSETNRSEIGELSIGGVARRCLIGSENFHDAPEFRSTGDLAQISADGKIRLIGRVDHQVKRMGKRISLDEITTISQKSCYAENSACIFDSQSNLIHCVVVPKLACRAMQDDVILGDVKKVVTSSLPIFSTPDNYVLFDHLPLNTNGKVDRAAILRKILVDQQEFSRSSQTFADLSPLIQNFVKKILHLPLEQTFESDAPIWALGFDSIKFVRLVEIFENHFQCQFPDLFEVIRSKNLRDLIDYVKSAVSQHSAALISGKNTNSDDKGASSCGHGGQIESSDDQQVLSRINAGKNQAKLRNNSRSVEIIGDQIMSDRISRKKRRTSNVKIYYKAGFNDSVADDPEFFVSCDSSSIEFKLEWSLNLGKCVDASPLIVEMDNVDRATLFIGSHAHKFISVELPCGKVNWTAKLGGRIEAGATVTPCGSFIIVGCYDFCVYFLCRISGKIFWKHPTENVVKSAALCSTTASIAYIGSYDRCLHALDYLNRVVKWKINLNGAILSTPVLCEKSNCIFVATLAGGLFKLCAASGAIIWEYNVKKPVFASIKEFGQFLIVLDVQGFFHSIDSISGTLIQLISISALISTVEKTPSCTVFNAPCVFLSTNARTSADPSCGDRRGFRLIATTGQGFAVCFRYIDEAAGWEAAWTCDLGDQGAALTSPYVAAASSVDKISLHAERTKLAGDDKPSVRFRQLLCILCSSRGSIYALDAFGGEIRRKYKVEGLSVQTQLSATDAEEGLLFSSPVVWRNFVCFGSRDNFVYCLRLFS